MERNKLVLPKLQISQQSQVNKNQQILSGQATEGLMNCVISQRNKWDIASYFWKSQQYQLDKVVYINLPSQLT